MRKLIVVVPEKTDRKSVTDVLRKYLGVILAAVLASSLIEFFMRGAKVMQTYDYSLNEAPVPSPAIPPMPGVISTSIRMVNENIKGRDVGGIVPSPVATMVPPVPTAEVQSIPVATSTPIVPAPTSVGAWSANATATPVPVQPLALDNGAASQAAHDIFTNLANTITAHPGLLFLMGCLFVVALLIIMDYRRKRKNV